MGLGPVGLRGGVAPDADRGDPFAFDGVSDIASGI